MRRLHSLPGLIAAVIVCFMAVTGALLALDPAIEQARVGLLASPQLSVAALADAVAANVPGVERIVRSASGAVTAYAAGDGPLTGLSIDPATGLSQGAYQPSAFFAFLTELHRSLFFGEAGHAIAGIGALAMLVLSISGGLLLLTRLGGWSKLFSAIRGTKRQRLHVSTGRFALLGLLLSAATGLYMTLISFGLVSDGASGLMAFPANVDGGQPVAISELAALQTVPLGDLRELVFPIAGDPTDVFTIGTTAGQGFVDQATGDMLSFTPNSLAQTIYEAVYMLHTGQGVWWLGLLLGIAALGAPLMAVSGALIWWRRRLAQPRLAQNAGPHAANTVILVGSEGNSTWGFAQELHNRLTEAGHTVHTAPMNALARIYPRARRLFVLTATYGDGTAPASASRFLARLGRLQAPAALEFAVLGFGDRRFAHYCQFAGDVDAALAARGLGRLQPLDTIDRQSSQAFSAWGTATGARIRTALRLVHTPARPRTQSLVLAARVDYGCEVQAPTAVLQFVAPPPTRRGLLARLLGGNRLPRFEAGDLVGILPPGSTIPRYYSLASDARDGVLEICVRKHQGGLCSEFLHALEPGDAIDAFVTPNPDFRPLPGKAPVIMIGAGTGIAPLAGFIRKNRRHRPVHLYFGSRDPQSDFLYGADLRACLADCRLTRLVTAFSRIINGGYVQDQVRGDAESIRAVVARGAQIMVCGGKDMAASVMEAIDEIVSPLGFSVESLKSAGLYLEDVY